MKDLEFMLTEEQIELRNMVRKFAQEQIKPICRIAERDNIVPPSWSSRVWTWV